MCITFIVKLKNHKSNHLILEVIWINISPVLAVIQIYIYIFYNSDAADDKFNLLENLLLLIDIYGIQSEKSHDLPLASWRPRKDSGAILGPKAREHGHSIVQSKF